MKFYNQIVNWISKEIINLQGMDESLSMSLLERFDAMETEAGEPERRIGTLVMQRDPKGRLGVKIGGAPSGVYVDRIDWDVATVVNGSLQVRY